MDNKRQHELLPGDITLGSGVPLGINNRGHVVGAVSGQTVGQTHAALWTAGGLQDLGVLSEGAVFRESLAWGINNLGQAVGPSEGDFSGTHAFLWTASGGMQDLNTLIDPLDPLKAVTALSQAFGINNAGQIVGSGFINGKERAYLITPVPEPETWALLLVGLGWLPLVVRKRAS